MISYEDKLLLESITKPFVYKLTDKLTGKMFIGYSKTTKEYLPTTDKIPRHRSKFELIMQSDDLDELKQKRFDCIKEFNTSNPDFGFNVTSYTKICKNCKIAKNYNAATNIEEAKPETTSSTIQIKSGKNNEYTININLTLTIKTEK